MIVAADPSLSLDDLNAWLLLKLSPYQIPKEYKYIA
jgi:hypothetical protein